MNKLFLITIALMVFLSSFSRSGDSEYLWVKSDLSRVTSFQELNTFNGSHYVILKFKDLPGEIEQSSLRRSGIELLGYMEDGHYAARIMSGTLTDENLRTSDVEALALLDDTFLKTPLLEFYRSQQSIRGYSVKLWHAGDAEAFRQALHEANISIEKVDVENGVFKVLLGSADIDILTQFPGIAFIGPSLDGRVPLLDDAINMTRVNALQNTGPFGEDLSGEGINVGIWDGGLTGNHIDINGNVTNVEKNFYSASDSKHPTHVAGVVTGKGHRDVRIKGMAPETDVYVWSFEGDIIGEMNQGISDYNLNIINSSFYLAEYNDPIFETMCFFPGYYVLESQGIDKMVRDNPALVHTIANGNQNSDCQGGGGWSGIPIGLQGSKNVISVGWLDINEDFYGGSSVGPTYDGRLKPEVMAKGAQLLGPDLNHGYHIRWGSSGSSPTVAGTVALLQEWYSDNFGSMPDASLMRSVLCNTAQDDRFLPGPDNLFGFGRINGLRALHSLQDTSFNIDAVSNAQTKNITIEVPAGVSQVNICLAWTDKEAVPGAAKTLVNNLDLRVTAPDMTVYMPWTLDPWMPWLPPVTGIDSVNNVEQVSLFTPVAGTYTISVEGKEVPFGPQDYSLTYDIRQQGVSMTHPIGGERWYPGETQFVRWDPSGTGAGFTLDISYDDGSTWQALGTAASTSTFKAWAVKDTTSHTCRVRVSSGGFESISGPFTIMKRVASLYGNACDEHLTISWDPVRDADDYIVMILKDNNYIPVDTTTDTTYLFSDLDNGNEHWITVQARDGSNLALRSNGYQFKADGSDCGFTDDIGVTALCAPLGFRYAFDGSLPYASSLQVLVRNFGANAITGFDVCYQPEEGGGVMCETFPGTLGANAIDTFTFTAIESFADTLVYGYNIWTTYGADANNLNDSLSVSIKVVPSHAMPLPYYTGFEGAARSEYVSKSFALEGIEEWDFYASSASGRISVGLLDQLASEGDAAITLDEYSAIDIVSNEAILNLNLNGYEDSTIYLDFNYVSHGESGEAGDKIWGRADVTESWVELFDISANLSNSFYSEVLALNITEQLQFLNGQTFGNYFQLKFGQQGVGTTIFMNENEGRSFDEVKVYSAGEDLEVRNLVMQKIYCDSLDGTLPVTVTIRNNSPQDIVDFTAGYFTSGGFSHTEVIPFLGSYDSLQFTFSQELPYTPGTVIELDVFIDHSEDFYVLNDSISDVIIYIQPFGGSDYYESFENGGNVYRTYGQNSSWDLGTPANTKINGAASGDNAWVTNLTGRHNNNELSYLLTPCFDFSDPADVPNFAFNLKAEIEEDYDFLTLEFSEDGISWSPVLNTVDSYNWFNGGGDFWDVNVPEWKVASNNVSIGSLTDPGQVMFRFVFYSDQFYKEEGAGIDDIHVTMDKGPVYKMTDGSYFGPTTLSLAPGLNNLISGGEIVLGLIGDMAESATVGVAKETSTIFPGGNYALKRHFWTTASQSYIMRAYLPYSEYGAFYDDFPDWNAPSRMSILAYDGNFIDSSAANNGVSYTLIDEDLMIKPYRDGYLLEFEWSGPGEFYIVTDSAIALKESVDVAYMSATAVSPDNGLIVWGTNAESLINGFVVKAGLDGISYDSIGYVLAMGTDSTTADYSFTDSLYEKACLLHYKVCAMTISGDSIDVGEDTAAFVFPGMVATDSLSVTALPNDDALITWGTHAEKCNDRFDILVSTNGVDYSFHGSVISTGDQTSWTPYQYTDDTTPKQDSLCYILEQYNSDGSVTVYGPVCVNYSSDETLTVGSMSASAINPQDGLVEWNTLSESGIAGFVVKAGTDGFDFDSIGYLNANGTDSTTADYTFTDSVYAKACLMHYKVCALTISGDTLLVGTDTASFVFPSLVIVDSLMATILPGDDVAITWGTQKEKCNDRFELSVSINGGPFNLLSSVASQGDSDSWTPYSSIDNSTPKQDTLCYELEQFYSDGTSGVYGPVCVIFESDTTAMSINIVNVTDVSCAGGSDGAIDIEIINGTPPFTIRWSDGSVTEDISNLTAGEYVVYIEDATGETAQSALISVGQPAPLFLSGGAISGVQCNGASNGAVTGLTVSGGTSPYSFSWSNGGNDLDNTELPAGYHQLTITDDNGCELLSPIYYIQDLPAISLLSVIISDADCHGTPSGSIDLEVAGGTPLYDFEWDNGQLGEDLVNVIAGAYSCTITDDNGCEFVTEVFNVGEAAAITIANVSIDDVTCAAGNDGSIDIQVNGGTPPYTYDWSNGDDSQDIDMLMAGSYSVTILDAAGCSLISEEISVAEPSALAVEILGVIAPGCHSGSDGGIDIEISGGIPPYTVIWSNGSSSQDLSDIEAGFYDAVITDAVGCSINTGSIEVTQPEAVFADNLVVTHNSCFGGEEGSISLDVNGGSPPYDYSWNNGEADEDLTGLPAGEYILTITDSEDCESVTEAIIIEEAELITVSGQTEVVNPNCFTSSDSGTINLVMEGGNSPYSYLWNNSDTTANITDLEDGLYTCEVTDANGCNGLAGPFTIERPAPVELLLLESIDVACHGEHTGSIYAEATSAVLPMEYQWFDGNDFFTTQNLIGIPAGTYQLSIFDGNGCPLDSALIIEVLEPEESLELSISTSPESGPGNSDGTATLDISGGDLPYSIHWSNGANTQNLANVPAGEYCAQVLDGNDCVMEICADVGLGTFVSEIPGLSGLYLYPNPASSEAILKMVFEQSTATHIELIDVSGRILENTYGQLELEQEVVFEVSTLAAGTYIVRITTDDGVTSLPLVIQH
ncbi:MAG: S8 family serine peptidase [Bacteroidetes bacterium]|nr:S8 family serine peptidase [Bacteroidota bacterium]